MSVTPQEQARHEVTLREHLEMRMAFIEALISRAEKSMVLVEVRIERHFASVKADLDKAETQLGKKLDEMNALRLQIEGERTLYATKDETASHLLAAKAESADRSESHLRETTIRIDAVAKALAEQKDSVAKALAPLQAEHQQQRGVVAAVGAVVALLLSLGALALSWFRGKP